MYRLFSSMLCVSVRPTWLNQETRTVFYTCNPLASCRDTSIFSCHLYKELFTVPDIPSDLYCSNCYSLRLMFYQKALNCIHLLENNSALSSSIIVTFSLWWIWTVSVLSLLILTMFTATYIWNLQSQIFTQAVFWQFGVSLTLTWPWELRCLFWCL